MTNVYIGDSSEKSGGSKSGSKMNLIKPLIGVAILGGAAYLGYKWYTENKCDTLGASNRTINGVSTAGCCKPFPMDGFALFNVWSAGACPASGCASCGTNGGRVVVNQWGQIIQ